MARRLFHELFMTKKKLETQCTKAQLLLNSLRTIFTIKQQVSFLFVLKNVRNSPQPNASTSRGTDCLKKNNGLNNDRIWKFKKG